MHFKGETIEDCNACFPSILSSLKFFHPQGWMVDVFYEKFNFSLKYFPDMRGEILEVFFEGRGSGNLHGLRSARKSSTDENSFIFS